MEQKKYVRPTWAMVRELESKLEDQIDGTSRLVADCDAWRDKYHGLKTLYDEMVSNLVPADDYLASIQACERLSSINDTLEKSNKLLEEELKRLRQAKAELETRNDNLCDELYRVQTRGFLARVFNRG